MKNCLEVLKQHGYKVKSTDIIDRWYADTEVQDFLSTIKEDTKEDFSRDIITNPLYKFAQKFVEHALDISMDGTKVAMFLKLTFLENKTRKKIFEKYPPKVVYVSSSRLQCAKNGDFDTVEQGTNNAIVYAWYVWEKGFTGDPIIKRIN